MSTMTVAMWSIRSASNAILGAYPVMGGSLATVLVALRASTWMPLVGASHVGLSAKLVYLKATVLLV